MRCSDCGAEVPNEAAFCHRCGKPIAPGVVDDPGDATDQVGPLETAGPQAGGLRLASRRPSADSDETQVERDLWRGSYSPQAMVGHAVLAGIGTLLAAVGAILAGASGWVLAILAVAVGLTWVTLLIVLIYRQLSVRYLLTNHRFIHESGILRRLTDRLEVIDIDDITVEQGLVQRLLGVGTIRISSSDRTHPELVLRGIAEVQQIAATMDDTRRAERLRRGLHIESI